MVILTTMMWGFGSESRQHAAQRDCQLNLKKIYLALQIYARYFRPAARKHQRPDFDAVLDVLVPRYTVDTPIFICPGGKDCGARRACRCGGAKSAMPITWASAWAARNSR